MSAMTNVFKSWGRESARKSLIRLLMLLTKFNLIPPGGLPKVGEVEEYTTRHWKSKP